MNTTMHPSCLIVNYTTINVPLVQQLVGSMKRLGYEGEPLLTLQTGQGEYHALTGSHRIRAALQLNLIVPVHVLDVRHHNDSGPQGTCTACVPLEECVVSQLLDASTNEERLALLVDYLPSAIEAIHIMQLEVSHDLFN